MTVSDLEARLSAVEAKLARLEEQVERDKVCAGIDRGLVAADLGKMAPAREVLEGLRVKHKIPQA